jgi:hypothetical protein
MKTKKKNINDYQKALKKMEKETSRAVAHVHLLQKLYEQSVKKTQVQSR